MKTLIYLATPYSDPDPTIREQRFCIVNGVAARLMREGYHIFSPISHTHPIALAGDLPKGWDFWHEFDKAVLSACAKVIVLRQPGWETSTGVKAEIKLAQEMGLSVEYIDQ